MMGRFSNSAEYSMEDVQLEPFINHLVMTGHFLLFSEHYQEEGTFIVADPTLLDRREGAIESSREHSTSSDYPATRCSLTTSPLCTKTTCCLPISLIFRPAKPFIWHGTVVYGSDIPHIDLDIKDLRIRLVADGGHSRLSKAKKRFTEYFSDSPESSPDEPPGGEDDEGSMRRT
jgi:mitogen-activated protein kinase kinase kinase